MPTPLLVITADIPFGDLIRRSLEETGNYVVGVTGELEAAKVYAREFKPALTFLDTSLAENDLLRIGALLRQSNPEVIFVVISEAGWHSALEELFPREFLSKPFQLTDLLEIVNRYIPSSTPHKAPNRGHTDSVNELPWLSDVNRAAQHLTRLTLESSAQAALINRADQLWAYAGQLPQPAAHELAGILTRYWDHQEENDLVRFVKLASTNAEYMLYATRLAEGMVLALVFDAETPFSTIRTQASQLVHSLSSSPSEDQPDGYSPDNQTDPSPNPDTPADSGHDFKTVVPGSRKESRQRIFLPAEGSFDLRKEYSFEPDRKPLVEIDQNETAPVTLDQTDQHQRVTRNYKIQRIDAAPESSEDTRPHPYSEGARKIVLEPVSASIYNLDYVCVLVPRLPLHHITGDLLDRLSDWVPQICIAFAWRLEYISVRPEYLQCIVNVPPVAAPAYLMRILRQHTSDRIFSEFPRYKKENPSGEFWAPGYLIMGGSQPPPAQLIKDFIAQTRKKQGISQQYSQ